MSKLIDNKMQIVFTDGLGNQMFQYALYLSMQAQGRKPSINVGVASRGIVHNGFELFEDFELDRNKTRIINGGTFGGGVTLLCLRKIKSLCYYEKSGVFDDSVFKTHRLFISGYWQDSRYFAGIEDKVRESFLFKGIDEKNKVLSNEMKNCSSVSIHIRRGDYLKFPDLMICTPEYYDKAVQYIKDQVRNPVFYVFSDDIQWSDAFMKERGVDYKLVSLNRGRDSYKDMYLMTQCHHNIIANSSFSWWGAWLGNYKEKIVVCPSVWRKNDLLSPQLDKWIKIDP